MLSLYFTCRRKALARSWSLPWLLGLSLWLFALPIQGQGVVINEVFPTGQIELKNTGSSAVDVSTYWLCQFPNYLQLQDATLLCGSLVLQPGEILAVSNFNAVDDPSEGEVGLYLDNQFGNPNSIIDYVDWGVAGGGRSGVAVDAGIWTDGDVVPAFPTGSSIEYDGAGNSSGDWNVQSSPTVCQENGDDPQVCIVDGGTISTTAPTELCLNDQPGAGQVDFSVAGSVGDARAWIATDPQGNIQIIQDSNTFDFSDAATATFVVYYIRWEPGNFGGFAVGNNIADLTGCFDLSNGIPVSTYAVSGGTIATQDETTRCVDDSEPDVVNFTVSGSVGDARAWVATDEQGNIEIIQDNGSFDFTNSSAGTSTVYYIRWEPGNFGGFAVGNNIGDLTGCFDLSNEITVTRLTDTDCPNDNQLQILGFELLNATDDVILGSLQDGDQITQPNVQLSAKALPSVDPTGSVFLILSGPISAFKIENISPYTLFGDNPNSGSFAGRFFPEGQYALTAIPFTGPNLSGNAGLPLTINFEIVDAVCNVDGGTISTTAPTELCLNDQPGAGQVDFSVAGSVGDARAWIATDPQGNIQIIQDSNTFDFSDAATATFVVYYIRWEPGNFGGFAVGNNIADLTGCFDLSNGIPVSTYAVSGGTIATQDETTRCVDDSEPDVVNFTVSGSVGDARAWVATDEQGNIEIIQDNGSFDFTNSSAGTSTVYYIRWEPGNFGGFAVGNNIGDLTGCFDLSNGIDVTKLGGADCDALTCNVDGGAIGTEDATDLCLNDQPGAGLITFLVAGSVGDARAWIATDPQGNIQIIQDSNTFDFSDAATATFVVYYIRWEPGNFGGFAVGNNIADLTGCFDLSNGIPVSTYAVSGGTIATQDETTRCVDDSEPDVVNFTVSGSVGDARAWVATDEQGNIEIIQDNGSFDFTNSSAGTSTVYYIRWEPGNFGGFAVGNNIGDLTGCFDLSNGIDVTKLGGDDCGDTPSILAFQLIDATSDRVIGQVQEGDRIGQTNSELSLAAISSQGTTESVELSVSGPIQETRTENEVPYTLFGDNPSTGDINGRVFAPGTYTVTATPYTEPGLGGVAGTSRTVTFEVAPSILGQRASEPEQKGYNQMPNFEVFPNPTSSDQLYIAFEKAVQSTIRIQLQDLNGKTVKVYEFASAGSRERLTLSFSEHPVNAGLYFLQVQVGDRASSTRKIIISR